MSGQLKEVRNRIKSVKSTQQITKAMKLVSAAKLRRATDKITQMRPYAERLGGIMANISGSLQGEMKLNLTEQREVNNLTLVLVTSDRGLCGAYNANLIKKAKSVIANNFNHLPKSHITIVAVGKKGADAFKKEETRLVRDYAESFLNLSFETAGEIASYLMNEFESGNTDHVEVIYSKFKNAAVQTFTAEAYLPIAQSEEEVEVTTQADFIFEPGKKEIIIELIPKILRTQMYKCMLDANASEHGARMTSMDKATENANDLLKDLKLTYNRARQAAITTELNEIVSGAAALEG